jgi:hypothetical protein
MNVSYYISTDYGKFIVKFSVSKNRNTNEITSFNINIGSKEKFCVQLKVPSKESKETEGYLMWVESDEQCSLEKYIQKGIAQHMVLIGLTLARKLNPNLETVSFEDTSSFECDLPDGTKRQVPMKIFHIAFHEATWYEYYFGAKLKKNYEEYCKLKKNMYKSEHKPKEFDFINQELQEELEPLYKATSNWYDFFQAISKKYDKKKCTVIYPWIISAMNNIFDYPIYDTKWYIDFRYNEKQNKTPIVKYSMSEKIIGGRRKTIKKSRRRRITFSRTHLFPNIPQIQKFNYRAYLSM